MEKDIKATIIALITESQVVINKGKKDGIEEGMFFNIRLDVPDIADPEDSSNTLSGIFYSKGTIKINSVFERMSFGIIQPSTTYYDRTVSGAFAIPEARYKYPEVIGKVVLSKEEWAIKVGDEVHLKKESEAKLKK